MGVPKDDRRRFPLPRKGRDANLRKSQTHLHHPLILSVRRCPETTSRYGTREEKYFHDRVRSPPTSSIAGSGGDR